MSIPRKIRSLDNLIDFLVEDIMAMSDEEILAEATPEDIEAAERLKDEMLAAMEGK